MAKRIAWLCTGMGMAIMALTGVGLYVFAPALMGIFTADAAVIALGAQVLRIEAFAEPMFGASIVASGAMQGAGDSTGCFVLNLVSMWGIRLTLAVLLAPRFGLVGVWFAMCAELCTRGALFLLRLARGKWLDKGAADAKAGCCGSVTDLFALPFNHHPMVEQGLRAEEAGALLQAFFKDLRVRLAARPKWKRPAPPAENMKKP